MVFARRFQVELLPDVAWAELRRRVKHAEELGFDIATTADQFVDWKNPKIPWFDVWATLAAFAEATDRIRLAPCVAQIPMRDPATYARFVLTVDHISGGRIEAGLGLGLTVDPGYGMIGVENWDNPQRADRFGEYVRVVEELLRTSECSFKGDYYTVEQAAVHVSVQEPRPPMTVAAMGPRMMRYAAAHADTWNTMSFGAGAEVLLADATALKSKMAAACETEGRDPRPSAIRSYSSTPAPGRAAVGSSTGTRQPRSRTSPDKSSTSVSTRSAPTTQSTPNAM